MMALAKLARLCVGLAFVALCGGLSPLRAAGLPPIRKVAVYVAPAREGDLTQLSETLGASVVELLGQSGSAAVSQVRPTAELAGVARGLCAGELGRRIAVATEADVVLIITLAEELAPARVLIAGLAAFDARRNEIDLPPTLRATLDESGLTTAFERSVAGLWARWLRLAAYPTAEVLDVRASAPRQEIRCRVDGPLPANAAGYDAERLGPSLVSETTAERFVAEGRPLGRAVLGAAEGDIVALTVGDRIPLAPGARLRLLPADGALPRGEGSPLVVTSRPWGALVTVDSEVRGLTPTRLMLPAGDREIGASHPLALPWRRVVTAVDRGAGLFTVPLQLSQPVAPTAVQTAATLRVESEPAEAEVVINGEVKGRTPLDVPGLSGDVEVAVRRAGYRPWSTKVTMAQAMNLKATLEALAGVIRVTSEPPGAKVLLNGKDMGVTPIELSNVPPGEHEVVVVPAKGEPTARRLVLAAGQTAKVEVGAKPAPSPNDVSTSTLTFVLDKILWQQKLPLGRDAGLHVVLAQLNNGHQAFSVVVSPSRPSLLTALPDGLAIDFPGVKGLAKPAAWEVPKHPHVVGVTVEPLTNAKGGFRVRLVLRPGAVARMHETSAPERLRFILETKPVPVG